MSVKNISVREAHQKQAEGYGGARDPMTGAVRAEGWAQAGLPVESEAPDRTDEALRAGTREGGR